MAATISVVLPFLGTTEEALRAIAVLAGLRTSPGDELIIADNTPDGIVAGLADARLKVADASDRRSASHARNVGAALATGDWLLFVDADCTLEPDLLARHRIAADDPDCGIVAGEVAGQPDQDGLLPRWARSRRGFWVEQHQTGAPAPAGVTANMLVRREAWQAVGGFRTGGGGDLDLSWRLQKAGWKLTYHPEIVVLHRDRETLRDLISQAFSYGSHQSRLRALHGEAVPRPRLGEPLVRAGGGAVLAAARGRGTETAFKLIDGVWALVFWLGDRVEGRGARRAD